MSSIDIYLDPKVSLNTELLKIYFKVVFPDFINIIADRIQYNILRQFLKRFVKINLNCLHDFFRFCVWFTILLTNTM